MTNRRSNPDFAGSWPLFDGSRQAPFPADPRQALSDSWPAESEHALHDEQNQNQFSESGAAVPWRVAVADFAAMDRARPTQRATRARHGSHGRSTHIRERVRAVIERDH